MPSPSLIDRRTAMSPAGPAGGVMITPGRVVATVASAVLRAAAAVASSLLLVGGVALLLWAVTPGSGSDAAGLLSGGVVAFAAAHFLPVSIGAVPLTLRPLMLTLIAVVVIASSAGRARPVRGRTLEAVHGAVFALTYALLVAEAIASLASAGGARPGVIAPLCVAAVGVLLGIALHRTAWNRWWRHWAPPWLRTGMRAGLAAACLLLAAGAVAVAIGLMTSFSDASAVASITAPSAGDGFGLLLLCLAFLPNAVMAGVGYVSGAGFSLGGASYSPLAVHGADLPAIPLLAAAPDGGELSRSALLAFVAPAAAAMLVTVIVCRRLSAVRDRLAAAALAAAAAGLVIAGFAAAARGGVAGGPWESTGVAPLLAGGLIAGVLLVVAGVWTGLSGLRTVQWAARRAPENVETVEDVGTTEVTGVIGDEASGPVTDDAEDSVTDDADGSVADDADGSLANAAEDSVTEGSVTEDIVTDDGPGDDAGDVADDPDHFAEPVAPADRIDSEGDFPDRADTDEPSDLQDGRYREDAAG